MAKISRWLPLTALAGLAIGGGLWLGLAGPSEKPAALPATADAPEVREAWLRRIGELLKQGKAEDAKASPAEPGIPTLHGNVTLKEGKKENALL